jgi:hypothetical protein
MKFEYKRYRTNDGSDLTRPIIRVLINNPRDPRSISIAYEALVDSGADFCVFPAEIAELLQIDLTAGEERHAGGVVASERRPVYFIRSRSKSVRMAIRYDCRYGLASCRTSPTTAMASSAATVFSAVSRL